MAIRGGTAYRQHQSFKEAIRERDGFTCQLCGVYGYTVDHIVPYAISGETKPDGVRILCHDCNLKTRRERKDANHFHSLEEWFGYLADELANY